MASLSFTYSKSCQGTQAVLTLTGISDAPTAPAGGQYRWEVVNNATQTDYGTDPATVNTNVQVPDGGYTLRVYADYPDGSTAQSSPQTTTVACGGNSGGGGGGGGGGTGPAPVYGCLAPNAFNYDAEATADTSPSACVFVLVDTAPAPLVAAHLPIPVVVRAAPTLTGVPALVRLLLQTAPTPTTPDADWVEFGQLVAVCDADDQAARFDVSEATKSLLRIQPPVEEGPDPALSALLRVRYEVLDPDTRAVAYSGLVGTTRALNAVVPPLAGALLNTPSPYAELPPGGLVWQTRATFAGGVVAEVDDHNTAGCPARQFVWLNRTGAWDSGFFYGRHQHGTDIADAVGYRDAAGADRWASRGTVRPTLQVYSDVTDWPTYLLLRGLRTAVQVYERVSGGQYVPVLVKADSFPEYQEVTDKVFQVNFTVSYPAQLVQTQ